MKKYDFIFGIGRACACSQSLRKAGLQLLSLPWDWLATTPSPDGPDLDMRLKIMESGFVDWLREEDLVFVNHVADNGKDQYRNKRYSIVYPHDFPRDVPLHESFPAVKAKYDRRVQRLMRLMTEAKTCVLAVYMDSPLSALADVETCRDAQRRLQALCPNAKVDFLMFSLEYGRSFDERTVEDLGNGFTRVAFDFKDYKAKKLEGAVDLRKCAEVMKSLASVCDYRSPAEIKAMVKRTRQKKMQEAGAKNAWEFFLIRRRRELARLKEALSPRLIIAKMRKKKFDHVLSLGMNCETAFRFSLSWGFVDSTPFAWALFSQLDQLADAIEHPEHIGSEGFTWNPKAFMWHCNRTQASFHGQLVMSIPTEPPDPKALEADREDLMQRLKYLNEKFTRLLSDDSSKAIVCRIHTHLALADDVNAQADAIQRALESRGARNYTLVIVTERAARGKIAPAPNRVIRTVRAFNPGASVVKEKLGDPVGWRALFAEFTPAKILPKKHLFKFEKE